MPKKLADDTIYMKVNGKLQPIGRLYDRDHIGYGSYFVTNTKYNRSLNWIGAAPNPNFIELETALEESRDNLREEIRNIFKKYLENPDNFYDYYMVDNLIQAIRKTFLDKKTEMLHYIKS
jgi:hypothetical protein